jgi:glycosyltransferase involved in cell wall biosynthesis
MSAVRLNMVRHLAALGIPLILVHCYRGWTDLELLRQEPYSSLVLSPSAFYGVGGAVTHALSSFRPNTIQADYLSILTGPAFRASQRFRAILVAEMHYVPSRFFRDQGLGNEELQDVNRLFSIVASVADAVVCWTANDRDALQEEGPIPPARLYTVPAPIDTRGAAAKYNGAKSIVFLGNLYFHQNATALRYICRSILPVIRYAYPTTTLTVVGDCPAGFLSRDQSRHVRVLGYCDDLTPIWSEAVAALAPMSFSNGGVHVKVLTALAAGVPVVGSDNAVRGLPPMDGLFVCRSPAEYGDVLARLLRDETLRYDIGQLARQGIREHFDALRSAESLKRIYEQTLAKEPIHKCIPVKNVSDFPVELRDTLRNGKFGGSRPRARGNSSSAWVEAAPTEATCSRREQL